VSSSSPFSTMMYLEGSVFLLAKVSAYLCQLAFEAIRLSHPGGSHVFEPCFQRKSSRELLAREFFLVLSGLRVKLLSPSAKCSWT